MVGGRYAAAAAIALIPHPEGVWMFIRLLRSCLLPALLLVAWPLAASAEDGLLTQTHQADAAPPNLPADVLVRFIMQTIAPQSWQGHGGTGTIEFIPQTGSLIVHQTPEVHQRIRQLLSELRDRRDEVWFDVYFVSVVPEWMDHATTEGPCFSCMCIRKDFDDAALLHVLRHRCEQKESAMAWFRIEPLNSVHLSARPKQPDSKANSELTTEFMGDYRRAWTEGRLEEAMKLAWRALVFDVTCFSKAEEARP